MGIKDKVSLWSAYHNPLHYWWKARKHFKMPKPRFICGKYHGYFGLPISDDYYGTLNLHCVGLGWKEKFGTPRHEWDPIVCVTFTSPFRTRHSFNGANFSYHQQYWIGWVFNWVERDDDDSHVRSVATWEAMLDVVVYGRSIDYAREHHVWHGDGKITIDGNLRNPRKGSRRMPR